MEVIALGLAESMEYQKSQRWLNNGLNYAERHDRAILVQTSANLRALSDAKLNLREPLVLQPGTFGENIFLDAPNFGVADICVGDVFSLSRAGQMLPVQLQVSSPRCPCFKIDTKNGQTFTASGVRAHCAATGHAGFFLRVLVPGDIKDGDLFHLTARPHPSWDLARVSSLLYGHPIAVMNYATRSALAAKDGRTEVILREEWMGSEAELVELAALPELTVCEYKEYLVRMLGLPGIGRYRPRRGLTLGSLGESKSAIVLASSAILIAAVCVGVVSARRSSGR